MGCFQSKEEESSLTQEEMDYLVTNTHFTKSQIKKWHRGFTKDCPEGHLTRTAFLDMYASFFPDDKAKPFYEHLFRTFDQDNSGNIDFREFIMAIATTQNGTAEEKLNLAFKLYDIDNNGRIEPNELTEIIKAIFLMVGDKIEDAPEDRTKAIFDRMDSNKDNVLSKSEFIQGCLEDEQLYQLLACSDSNAKKQQQQIADEA